MFTGKPSAPQLLEVSNITDDSVTLSWLSPVNDGGARVFRYVVELRDVSRAEGWTYVKEVDSSDILVACVEGLKEGKPYQFRVYAENEVGPGPAAELRDRVIPRSQLGKTVIFFHSDVFDKKHTTEKWGRGGYKICHMYMCIIHVVLYSNTP